MRKRHCSLTIALTILVAGGGCAGGNAASFFPAAPAGWKLETKDAQSKKADGMSYVSATYKPVANEEAKFVQSVEITIGRNIDGSAKKPELEGTIQSLQRLEKKPEPGVVSFNAMFMQFPKLGSYPAEKGRMGRLRKLAGLDALETVPLPLNEGHLIAIPVTPELLVYIYARGAPIAEKSQEHQVVAAWERAAGLFVDKIDYAKLKEMKTGP